MLTDDLAVSAQQTPSVIHLCAPRTADMGKRGLHVKEEEEAQDEVAAPATPPAEDFGVADVRYQEEDTNDAGNGWQDEWSQDAQGWWCKAEDDVSWWQPRHSGCEHHEGQQWAAKTEENQEKWSGCGSSRSGSSSSQGYYVHGGWVGPDRKFYPMPAFKAVPLFVCNRVVVMLYGKPPMLILQT